MVRGGGDIMEKKYTYTDYPLARNGINLHLDCVSLEGESPAKSILLVHGVTYSTFQFDLDYKDYSFVRFLARQGYAVWRLDIAGFGKSGAVPDGYMPDSEYAAEDINAAVDKIIGVTGQSRIDLLGWSWGTVTTSRFAAKHPEKLNKLVLYAPILCGLGEQNVTEPFHKTDWADSLEDFQRDENGDFDFNTVEPELLWLKAAQSWRYDGHGSPNGGRRDICVDSTKILIGLEKIQTPTLVICGDRDWYLDMKLVYASPDKLPLGSRLEVISGAAHAMMLEKPYHNAFQNKVAAFLD